MLVRIWPSLDDRNVLRDFGGIAIISIWFVAQGMEIGDAGECRSKIDANNEIGKRLNLYSWSVAHQM